MGRAVLVLLSALFCVKAADACAIGRTVRDEDRRAIPRAIVSIVRTWSATVFNEGGRFLLTHLPRDSYGLISGAVGQTIRVDATINNLVVKAP